MDFTVIITALVDLAILHTTQAYVKQPSNVDYDTKPFEKFKGNSSLSTRNANARNIHPKLKTVINKTPLENEGWKESIDAEHKYLMHSTTETYFLNATQATNGIITYYKPSQTYDKIPLSTQKTLFNNQFARKTYLDNMQTIHNKYQDLLNLKSKSNKTESYMERTQSTAKTDFGYIRPKSLVTDNPFSDNQIALKPHLDNIQTKYNQHLDFMQQGKPIKVQNHTFDDMLSLKSYLDIIQSKYNKHLDLAQPKSELDINESHLTTEKYLVTRTQPLSRKYSPNSNNQTTTKTHLDNIQTKYNKYLGFTQHGTEPNIIETTRTETYFVDRPQTTTETITKYILVPSKPKVNKQLVTRKPFSDNQIALKTYLDKMQSIYLKDLTKTTTKPVISKKINVDSKTQLTGETKFVDSTKSTNKISLEETTTTASSERNSNIVILKSIPYSNKIKPIPTKFAKIKQNKKKFSNKTKFNDKDLVIKHPIIINKKTKTRLKPKTYFVGSTEHSVYEIPNAKLIFNEIDSTQKPLKLQIPETNKTLLLKILNESYWEQKQDLLNTDIFVDDVDIDKDVILPEIETDLGETQSSRIFSGNNILTPIKMYKTPSTPKLPWNRISITRPPFREFINESIYLQRHNDQSNTPKVELDNMITKNNTQVGVHAHPTFSIFSDIIWNDTESTSEINPNYVPTLKERPSTKLKMLTPKLSSSNKTFMNITLSKKDEDNMNFPSTRLLLLESEVTDSNSTNISKTETLTLNQSISLQTEKPSTMMTLASNKLNMLAPKLSSTNKTFMNIRLSKKDEVKMNTTSTSLSLPKSTVTYSNSPNISEIETVSQKQTISLQAKKPSTIKKNPNKKLKMLIPKLSSTNEAFMKINLSNKNEDNMNIQSTRLSLLESKVTGSNSSSISEIETVNQKQNFSWQKERPSYVPSKRLKALLEKNKAFSNPKPVNAKEKKNLSLLSTNEKYFSNIALDKNSNYEDTDKLKTNIQKISTTEPTKTKTNVTDNKTEFPLRNMCGIDNSNTLVQEGTSFIEQYPWLGVLTYPRNPKETVFTAVVLIQTQIVISSALDIQKLPRNDFRSRSRVILGHKCNDPGIKVLTYNFHPDYSDGVVSSLVLVQLDLTDVHQELRPICPPANMLSEPTVYAMVLSDNCKNSKIHIYEMEYVEPEHCQHYYRRSGLDVESIWPVHYACGRTKSGGECKWRNGVVLAAKQNGRWHLLGFGVEGPGCAAPARFLDYGRYHAWVHNSVARIGRPAITRMGPNHLILRRSLDQIQKYGPCDLDEIKAELWTDWTNITKHDTNGKITYNFTILSNVDYSCITFRVHPSESVKHTLPHITLKHFCLSPFPICYEAAILQVDFSVEITFASSVIYMVGVYGKERSILDSKKALRMVNVRKALPVIPFKHQHHFPVMTG